MDRFGVPPRTAALTTAVFALSALAPYGSQVYPELPAALAVTAAIAALTTRPDPSPAVPAVPARRRPGGRSPSPGSW